VQVSATVVIVALFALLIGWRTVDLLAQFGIT
jgi:hypothetical protein